VQKQIVKKNSNTPIKAPTHMIMTIIRFGCLSLLTAPLGLGGEDAVVDAEALGDIVNAGADKDTNNSMSKKESYEKESKTTTKGYASKRQVIYVTCRNYNVAGQYYCTITPTIVFLFSKTQESCASLY
jgi:hypothetical protein